MILPIVKMIEEQEVPLESIKIDKAWADLMEDRCKEGYSEEALSESMRIYGQQMAVILNSDLEVLDGNRRIKIAKKLKWKTITALVLGQ